MRLSRSEARIIRKTAREVFGLDVTVSLFGSRTDDSARGGDIDLLVESPSPVHDRLEKILELEAKLQIRLGDQPIDVLLIAPDTTIAPIHEEARRTGIPL